MRDRIRALILLSISLVAAATLFALGRSLFADDPGTLYDINANGMIEGYEAVWAVRGYYEGDITQEQAVDLFLRYFGTVPIATPAPARAPTATATTVPTATPTPVREVPIITSLTAGDGNLTVRWKQIEGVRVYHVAYRRAKPGSDELPPGREWTILNEPGPSKTIGRMRSSYLRTGSYEVRVRGHLRPGWTEWSPPAYATVSIASTPTATPIVPVQRGCTTPTAKRGPNLQYSPERQDFEFVTTLINPDKPSQHWHDRLVSWLLSFTFWHGHRVGPDNRLILAIANDGSWALNIERGGGEDMGRYPEKHKDDSYTAIHTLDSGNLNDAGVSFSADWNARNSFRVIAKGRDKAVRLFATSRYPLVSIRNR